MNRRVEIKVCGEEGNVQLTKPDGADKFKNTGSSKSGSGSGSSTGSFKGDKNSGY